MKFLISKYRLLYLSIFILLPSLGFGQQIESSCDDDLILDCYDNCYPINWIGDGVCDNGFTVPSNFMCEEFNWDENDCGIISCGEGLVLDCDSNCVSIYNIGDGNCNFYDGINFSCSNFGYDGGDCQEGCDGGLIPDCFDNCYPVEWIGDGVCDNGYEVPSHFWCEEFNWDDSDCGVSSCGEGLVLDSDSNCVVIENFFTQDCNGSNIPISFLDALNNWHCNDGVFTMGYVASNTFNLNCEEFNYDGGDCNIPACMDPSALNYYEHANMDDGSCIYQNEDVLDYPSVLIDNIQLPQGSSPKGLCVLPQGDRIYAGTSSGVVVLSLYEENYSPVLIPTNGLIYSCSSSIDGSYVFAANWTQGKVDVIETSTNTIISSISSGPGTLKMKTSNNGQWVAASNHNDNSVSIINTENFELITQISVGETPRNIDFSNNDEFLYVANWTSGTLGVYSTSSWNLVAEVDVDYWPQAVCALPGDDYVLVGNFGFDLSYDHISVIRTSDWQVIARLQTGAGLEDIGFLGDNGEYIYVSNWGNACCFYTTEDLCCSSEVDKGTLTIIATPNFDSIATTQNIIDEIPYIQSTLKTVNLEGEYSFGLDVNPDFSEVYVANKVSNTISIVGFDDSDSQIVDCYNFSVNLNEGWSMIGYGCENNVDAEIAFSPIVENIIIAKDGYGNAYLPQWNFNGLGSLNRGYGYQIKIADSIENYNICNH
jgi:YVTN family beta-propeller protein